MNKLMNNLTFNFSHHKILLPISKALAIRPWFYSINLFVYFSQADHSLRSAIG
jgi:hypothetical protein